ncbi:carbohydrate deacetylase [Puia dinghuensis]|uniref:Carbohydrate deacetylase n=1 Tax=Puia dinghuensis TaxID=1792502 RepID=A0A8J2XWJ6_9BACT|nr:ChbG/HpnK family deacetylase [Puia dinghuensis]GGB24421.1 carbohydrate deacetylase [Puia dinghuensis]
MTLSKLIVNADDLGIGVAVNRAIFESIESGLVTSASIMANMPGFEDAVARLRQHPHLQGKIGMHLNLTEGHPLSQPILDCPVFCDDSGCFAPYRNGRRYLFSLSRGEKAAVYEEMKTQLQRVLAAGIKPAHLDSHHHFHTQWAIAPLVCRLGREYAIPRIRLARNIGETRVLLKRLYKAMFNRWRLGNRHEFHNTDYFGDIEDMQIFVRREAMKRNGGMEKRGRMEGKSVEVMVHPLYDKAGRLVDLDGRELLNRLTAMGV